MLTDSCGGGDRPYSCRMADLQPMSRTRYTMLTFASVDQHALANTRRATDSGRCVWLGGRTGSWKALPSNVSNGTAVHSVALHGPQHSRTTTAQVACYRVPETNS